MIEIKALSSIISLQQKSITHLHNFSGEFLFAEPVDDNVGRYPGHTEHPALGAQGQGLDGKRVLLYYICTWLLLLTTSPLKDLGSLQLVQHLKHNFDNSKKKKKKKLERYTAFSPHGGDQIRTIVGSCWFK